MDFEKFVDSFIDPIDWRRRAIDAEAHVHDLSVELARARRAHDSDTRVARVLLLTLFWAGTAFGLGVARWVLPFVGG